VAPGGAAGAAPAKIRQGPAAGLAGDARGVVLGWLGAGLGRSWGRSWPAARRAATPSGGSRYGPNSGMEGSEVVRLGRVVARVGAREGIGWVNLACSRLELGARRGGP
jgi:hypothetical protein